MYDMLPSMARQTPMVLALLAALAIRSQAQEFERPPIEYSKSQPNNCVSQLIERLESGQAKLSQEEGLGYLRSLLKELNVPASSQMLVFSKTSLQRQCITPRTPRALYFNDEVYVGFCDKGEMLEISAADPQLGAVFYTLEQESLARPQITRDLDNCLICHGSSQTKGVPGHVVRSVYADASGMPIFSSGTFRINQNSPLKQRWGGWYVTGTHGPQPHLGNLIATRQEPEDVDNSAGMNLTDIADRFASDSYLTPHSDIVALMVLEHQAEAQNLITQANFQTRQALHYEASLIKELGKPAGERWDSTKNRIGNASESLVEYLLFCEEAALTHKIEGTTSFAADFMGRGPRDKQGRSLRDFDLERRLFKYPCSYLVYSPAFEGLPPDAKEQVLLRLWEILSGKDQDAKFAHLSPADRTAILEILRDTLPDLPDYWQTETSG